MMTDFGSLCTKSHNQSNTSKKNPLIRIAVNSIIRGFTVFCYFITFDSLHFMLFCCKERFCFFYDHST